MPYLLNLVYTFLLLLGLPWLIYQSITKGKYREGFGAKLLGLVPRRTSKKTCVWLHAVSVGEVNLLAPLLREIKSRRPDWESVVSTTTITGMALARKKYADLAVFYCPLDFSWATAAAMRRIRPDILVLAELELWPNLVRAARRRGAKVAVINGRLSERSHRGYRRIRTLLGSTLRRIDLVAAQDETYAARFRDLGLPSGTVHVTGSMKYDGAQTDRANPATQRLAALAGFAPEDVVVLAGSTQEPEEAVVLEVFRRLSPEWPRLRLAIAPRHPERFDMVARMLDESGMTWRRRSKIVPAAECKMQNAKCKMQNADCRILLIDSVGELGAWWGAAAIAFVGGSLGDRGGQNMIEPAAYGAAVSFGPNTRNFRDIVFTMLAHQAAVVVHNADELTAFVRRCLDEPSYARELGCQAQALVKNQIGATRRTLELLERLLGLASATPMGEVSASDHTAEAARTDR